MTRKYIKVLNKGLPLTVFILISFFSVHVISYADEIGTGYNEKNNKKPTLIAQDNSVTFSQGINYSGIVFTNVLNTNIIETISSSSPASDMPLDNKNQNQLPPTSGPVTPLTTNTSSTQLGFWSGSNALGDSGQSNNPNGRGGVILTTSTLPLAGSNWVWFALFANIIMLFMGRYLRLHSGRSPGDYNKGIKDNMDQIVPLNLYPIVNQKYL